MTSSKYLWTVLFLIWALPSHFQPSYDRLIRMPGSSVSTFFQWEYVYRAEKVIKGKGLRSLFFRETAGICLHLCGDACWNATTNIFMFSETIFLCDIWDFYRCDYEHSFVSNTLYIMKTEEGLFINLLRTIYAHCFPMTYWKETNPQLSQRRGRSGVSARLRRFVLQSLCVSLFYWIPSPSSLNIMHPFRCTFDLMV